MLLINPPVVRICEPPLGLARLAGYLRSRGKDCTVWDACLEGLNWLLEKEPEAKPDREPARESEQGQEPEQVREPSGRPMAARPLTLRALKNRERNLAALRSPGGYRSFDAYKKALAEVQAALDWAAAQGPRAGRVKIGLGDYRDPDYSPVDKGSLARAAKEYRHNPFYPWFSRRLGELVEETRCRTVGISINFLSQAVCGFALAGFLEETCPEVRIIFGGGLITSWLALGKLREKEAFGGREKLFIAGPGEPALGEFFGFSGGTDRGWIACPDFSGLPLDSYLAPGRILPYNFSWGCSYGKCAFCPERAEGCPFVFSGGEEGSRTLRNLTETHRPALIHICDSEIPPAALRALIKNPPGVPWYGFCRFYPFLEDPEFTRALGASGCRMLQLGLESGDQEVLDAMNKGIRLDSSLKILRNLKDAGIGTYVYLLFGTPRENRRSAEKTLQLVRDHGELMDFLNLAVFNLPEAGPEAAGLKTKKFYRGDLNLYLEFEHPEKWGRREVREFLGKEFAADPKAAPILRRNPPVFTSSHGPFFLAGGCS